MKRGFTVVEVLITLVIIAILLGLGTVGLRSTLANGRDAERKADIETIARGLEARYNAGNSAKALPQTTAYPNFSQQGKGFYPGVNEFIHMSGTSRADFTPNTLPDYTLLNLPGTTQSSLITPSGKKFGQVCVYACSPAENQNQLINAFSGSEGSDRYLYEAVDYGGTICASGDCPSYNLYWVSETDTTVYKGVTGLKVLRSRHQ